MNVKFLNPFVDAAYEVIQIETGIEMQRGQLSLEKNAYVTEDLTVIISLVGAVEGNVLFSMPKTTAIMLVSKIMGQPMDAMDPLMQSGIAEMGNVITGRASIKLADAGYEANISPPTLLVGKGATIFTLDIGRIVVPLTSSQGSLKIHLALREGIQKGRNAAQIPVPAAPKPI
ncbi:MAG: chemotaxis protein CheX [Chloroflexota bacterium]|jgi:chemotaxis protein CheX